MGEDMLNSMLMVSSIYNEMKGMSRISFFSTLAVLIDSYCADNGYDSTDEAATLAKMVRKVNEKVGPMSRQWSL